MTVTELTTRLGLPAQTLAAIQEIPLPEHHAQLKSSFFNKTALFSDFANADPHGLAVLKLYLHWALDTRGLYARLGIPERHFWDSMKDLAIWCEDHITKHGTPGFREWEWVGYSLRLEVIRIGRLQFAPFQLFRDVTLNGTVYAAGTPVLEVHIPAGEPLDPGAALDSITQAPAFFKTHFGKAFPLMHCHSWLLSPELKELLPEQSRIIQFQNLFTVYGSDDEERQAEERVFGFLSDDPRVYPENTSLQKAVKQYMLDGKKVLMGAGIRLL